MVGFTFGQYLAGLNYSAGHHLMEGSTTTVQQLALRLPLLSASYCLLLPSSEVNLLIILQSPNTAPPLTLLRVKSTFYTIVVPQYRPSVDRLATNTAAEL